jgi:SAM-dependent methyltransferase
MTDLQKAIGIVDSNIDKMIKFATAYLIQLGTKHGVFSVISESPTGDELLSSLRLPNRRVLLEFIRTMEAIGIVEFKGEKLSLNGFKFELDISEKTYRNLLPSWVGIFEEIYKMTDYAFITPTHPHILMDFDKDADFWDLRMSTDFSSLYRKVLAELGEVKEGSSILDLGCGSVSPYEFGKMTGYRGFYTGVDYSPSLLEIAKVRVEKESLPVELKELDIRLIRPVNEYNTVVISLVLEYIKPEDYRRVIIRAMEALKPGGALVIFEPFRDKFENIEAIEFFERLNKDFKRFPYSREIKEIVKREGFDARIEEFGRSFIRIQTIP